MKKTLDMLESQPLAPLSMSVSPTPSPCSSSSEDFFALTGTSPAKRKRKVSLDRSAHKLPEASLHRIKLQRAFDTVCEHYSSDPLQGFMANLLSQDKFKNVEECEILDDNVQSAGRMEFLTQRRTAESRWDNTATHSAHRPVRRIKRQSRRLAAKAG